MRPVPQEHPPADRGVLKDALFYLLNAAIWMQNAKALLSGGGAY